MIVCPDTQIRRLLDARKDLIAVNRMELNLRKLFISQPAVFIDDRVWNTDLADIVEQRREIDPLAFLVRFSRFTGNLLPAFSFSGLVFRCNAGYTAGQEDGNDAGAFVVGVDLRGHLVDGLLDALHGNERLESLVMKMDLVHG